MICKFCSGEIFNMDPVIEVGPRAFIHKACEPFANEVKWKYNEEIHEQADSGREVCDRNSVLQDDDAMVYMEPDEHLPRDDGE